MTRIDDVLAKLEELHETAHQQVDRDEAGIPIDMGQMRRASDKSLAQQELSVLGRGHMFRVAEVGVRVAAAPCVCHPMDSAGDKCLGDIAREALADLADAILGKEKPND